MNLQQRKELLIRLGNYMSGMDEDWLSAKEKAFAENQWFIPQFIDLAVDNIARGFLRVDQLDEVINKYQVPENTLPKKIGLVMAGNIPLVGFHDLLCIILTGHYADIKPSSKDKVLIEHLVKKLGEWNEEMKSFLSIRDMLKHCDAYIATGSNNSSRYFNYYFGRYPSIIRKNRTSMAVLDGNESMEDLEKLADDVYLYFGLGCRNVTKIYVPNNYDFVPLLEAFKKYTYLADHHKYKNNYDYNLAIHMLNHKYYMTNGSILLIEERSFFSPISQLNYEFYDDDKKLKELEENENLQCLVSKTHKGFGSAQYPVILDFADGTDTIRFLLGLNKE